MRSVTDRNRTLIFPAVLAILLLVITFIFALLVMNNFGRGLKEQSEYLGPLLWTVPLTRICIAVEKNQHKAGLSRGKSQYVHRGPMSTHPNRMSID